MLETGWDGGIPLLEKDVETCERKLHDFSEIYRQKYTKIPASKVLNRHKPLKLLEFQGFFLFLSKSHDLILHIKILSRDEVTIMKKIEMPTRESKNFLEVFEMFVISR